MGGHKQGTISGTIKITPEWQNTRRMSRKVGLRSTLNLWQTRTHEGEIPKVLTETIASLSLQETETSCRLSLKAAAHSAKENKLLRGGTDWPLTNTIRNSVRRKRAKNHWWDENKNKISFMNRRRHIWWWWGNYQKSRMNQCSNPNLP